MFVPQLNLDDGSVMGEWSTVPAFALGLVGCGGVRERRAGCWSCSATCCWARGLGDGDVAGLRGRMSISRPLTPGGRGGRGRSIIGTGESEIFGTDFCGVRL